MTLLDKSRCSIFRRYLDNISALQNLVELAHYNQYFPESSEQLSSPLLPNSFTTKHQQTLMECYSFFTLSFSMAVLVALSPLIACYWQF